MKDERLTPSAVDVIYRGRIFTVQVEAITLPGGHALAAEIVRHPGSVVIVPGMRTVAGKNALEGRFSVPSVGTPGVGVK